VLPNVVPPPVNPKDSFEKAYAPLAPALPPNE